MTCAHNPIPPVIALGGGPSGSPSFSAHLVLLAKRDELRTLLRKLEGGLAIEDTREQLEAQVNACGREVAAAQIRPARALIRQIDMALERIADGTWGTCEGCDAPIAAKRLAVVPWAALCRDCAEVQHV